MNKIINVFLFVIVVASCLRLIGLGMVPYGFENDELTYILSGYTLGQTGGFDVVGKFLPISINLDNSLSPTPVYILAIFTKLLGLSPFVVRLPFALLGIGSIIVLFLISKELFKNKFIASLVSFSLSFSSWHLLITRGVWDVVPAQFFYLLGIYIFIKKIGKGNIIWSIPAFALAFFSYHATKVFFPFLILLLLIVFLSKLKNRKKEVAGFLIGVMLIFFTFALILKFQSVSRQQELVFFNAGVLKDAKDAVDFERTKSDAPEFLKKLESNKATFIFQKIYSTYLGAFSSQYLFTNGDISPIVGYGVFFRGVLYIIDIPFLLLGFIYLVGKSNFFSYQHKNKKSIEIADEIKRNRENFTLIVGLILISPTTSAFGAGSAYVIRSFMLAPFMAVLIGLGFYAFWEMISKKRDSIKLFAIFLVFMCYCFFISRFFYQYYFQFNSFGGEYWNVSSRQISEYIIKNSKQHNKIIIVSGDDQVLLQYAFFSHANAVEFQKTWKNKWPATLGNVTFIDTCLAHLDTKMIKKEKILYITHDECNQSISAREKIFDSLDATRVIWKIYD